MVFLILALSVVIRIEMFFGKIKENKRLSMRFEKLDETFLGFIALASLKIILNSIIS